MYLELKVFAGGKYIYVLLMMQFAVEKVKIDVKNGRIILCL